jgi:signal transduction histidine kinase
MSLRIKFALLFASLVTVILIISGLIILFFFENNRRSDFNLRLKAEGLYNYYNFYEPGVSPEKLPAEVKNNLPGSLLGQQVIILDTTYQLLYQSPANATINYNYELIQKIKKEGEYTFNIDNAEAVGIYVRDKIHPAYVIVAAKDRYGERKEDFLQYTLVFVLIAGLMLSGVVAFFYVKQLSKPFNHINDQVSNLTVNNLQQRITVPKNYDVLKTFASNFNKMLERIEKSFEIQKSFVHHASHELRTPLAVMLAQTESALGRELTVEESKKVLESLREDQQEMIELTNSLLLLSQYEKISYLNDWPLIRVDEMIYDNIAMIKKMYEDMNVSIEFINLPDNEADLSIKGNEALLRSAIRNLIKNAYSYSSDKQLSILLDATHENMTVHFDNAGKQLSQEEQDRLFVPFFRGANAQSKKGFGLGLSIVQRIVNIHKGTITYTALPDGINRFTLNFKREA